MTTNFDNKQYIFAYHSNKWYSTNKLFVLNYDDDKCELSGQYLSSLWFCKYINNITDIAIIEIEMGEKIKDVLIELDNDNMDNTHVLFYENLNKDEHYNYIDRLCNNYINTNNKETRHIIHLKNDFCTLKLRLNLTRINETDFKISATLPEFKYIF